MRSEPEVRLLLIIPSDSSVMSDHEPFLKQIVPTTSIPITER